MDNMEDFEAPKDLLDDFAHDISAVDMIDHKLLEEDLNGQQLSEFPQLSTGAELDADDTREERRGLEG